MDSDNFEDYIAAYIDQELSASEKKNFETLMESDRGCKVKFDQTMTLLNNIKAMPKLETSSDFSVRLQQRIESSKIEDISFIDKISSFLISSRPGLNFALSFSAIAVFTFIYLNDLSVFRIGVDSAEGTKQILSKEHIQIELAGGIDDEYVEVEDEETYVHDFEDDMSDENDPKFKINHPQWMVDSFSNLFDNKLNGWKSNPNFLQNLDSSSLKGLIQDLIKEVNSNRNFNEGN